MTGALFGLAMGFCGSMPLTGPIAILVFQRGLFGRYRDGMAVAFGAALAECVYCGLAIAGFGALLESYEALRPVSRAISVVILLALGVWFVRARLPEQVGEAAGRPGVDRLARELGQGFSITALNPTIVLNWSASIAVLYSLAPVRFDVGDKVLFVVAAGVGIVAWFGVLLAALRRFEGRLPARAVHVVVRLTGAALIVAAVYLAVQLV